MRARLEVVLPRPRVLSGVRLPSPSPPLNSSWLGDPIFQPQKLLKKNAISEKLQKHLYLPEGREAQLHIASTQPPTNTHYHTRLLWVYYLRPRFLCTKVLVPLVISLIPFFSILLTYLSSHALEEAEQLGLRPVDDMSPEPGPNYPRDWSLGPPCCAEIQEMKKSSKWPLLGYVQIFLLFGCIHSEELGASGLWVCCRPYALAMTKYSSHLDQVLGSYRTSKLKKTNFSRFFKSEKNQFLQVTFLDRSQQRGEILGSHLSYRHITKMHCSDLEI